MTEKPPTPMLAKVLYGVSIALLAVLIFMLVAPGDLDDSIGFWVIMVVFWVILIVAQLVAKKK